VTTVILSFVAALLAHALGLPGALLRVPRVLLPAVVPCAPRAGQVDRVAALPGEWTPQTGGGAP
jgi:hypothetical protein